MRKATITIKKTGYSANRPWMIEGLRGPDGKRIRRFFERKIDAETWLSDARDNIKREGENAFLLTDHQKHEAAAAFRRLAPLGRTVTEAVDSFIRQEGLIEKAATVEALVENFLATKKQDGREERTLKDYKSRLKPFVESFGSCKVPAVTSRQIDDWLRDLDVGPQSRANYRRILGVFYSYAVDRGETRVNPIGQTSKPKVVREAPEIFKPDELARLLDHADPEIIPALVIGAFAGLRRAEIQRLDWSEVDLRAGFVEVTAGKAKTASRRLVKILPNLAEWLAPYAKRKGQVVAVNERRMFRRAQIDAELTKWPANGLRHSFASYHLAKFQDSAALALELGHTDTSLLFKHYRNLVRPEDADRYWSICPRPGHENVVSFSRSAIQ